MLLDERNLDEVLAAIRYMNKEQCLRVNAECVDRIKTLRRAEVRSVAAKLNRGTRVRIKSGIKPKYMIGLRGIVLDILQTKALVEFDLGQDTGRFGRQVRVPISCLQIIEEG